jgi:hypothetical protein
MANLNKVIGQCVLTVGGVRLETTGGTQMEIGGSKREPKMGDYQAGAFSESTEPSKITAKVLYKGALDLDQLRKMDNVVAVLDTDVDTSWVVRGAYVAEILGFDSKEGTADVVLQGPPAEQVR